MKNRVVGSDWLYTESVNHITEKQASISNQTRCQGKSSPIPKLHPVPKPVQKKQRLWSGSWSTKAIAEARPFPKIPGSITGLT